MTTATLHTPLEELLFFQSLRADGVSSEGFAKISDTLKANELIHSSTDYDPERLSPENLQLLYLRLLKEEVRNNGHHSPRQEGEQNSRKRKLSTSPLQSIDEAAQHAHLLPQLIDRLYARYQSHIIEAIREDERVIRELQKDIEAIELGEWDAQLEAEQAAQKDAQRDAIQSILESETKQANALDHRERSSGTPQSQDSARKLERPLSTKSIASQPTAQYNSQPPTPATNSPIPYVSRPDGLQVPTRSPSQNALSPRGYASPSSHDGQRAPQHLAARSEKSTGSPAPLQPALTPAKGAATPASPLENLSERSTRPHQPTGMQQTPRQQGQLPNLPPHPQTLPQVQNKFQNYPNQPQFSQYQPYPQQGQGIPLNRGQALPPYATPNQGHPGQYLQQRGQLASQSPYGSFPGFVPGNVGQQTKQSGFPTQPQFSTPVNSASSRRYQNLPSINTAISSTKWKSTPRSSKGGPPKSPSPPPPSPFLPSSPSPSPEPETSKVQTANKQQTKLKEISRGESTPTRGRGRGRGRWGGHSGGGRGGRAASSTQESKEDQTRSQSVASHTDELARPVKNELPSTPLPVVDDTSAISTPGSTVRPGRRNTLRGLDLARPGSKRKRANTLEGSPDNQIPQTPRLPVRPGHILASRNFPRVTNPLMNDIMSHRVASSFAKPITDRDVPGYQSLILKPQDLKSIRLATSQGSRYIASTIAAADSVTASADESGAAATPPTSASGPGSKSASLWVEQVPEVMPPRGIVNSAQLEKEITRVFANAVMFNPDPYRGFGPLLPKSRATDSDEDESDDDGHYEPDDGGAFTRDAREMFGDVERIVGRWRAAERVEPGTETRMRGGDAREESETDELAEDPPEENTRGRRGRG